jgi:SAM-dependent methyltransferase
MIRTLPIVMPAAPGKPEVAGPDHPMRRVTRQVAFEPDGWTPERAGKVGDLFNGLAAEWHTRGGDERMQPLRDALARGPLQGGLCVEVGSGTGFGTRELAGHFERVVAIDLAREMLRQAPAGLGHRVNADGACLPLCSGAADAVVLMNALLFPAEVSRVLASDGSVVWVNSLGDRTPIHLSAADVEKALPGSWQGVASEAGWGTWCVLRRAAAS